MNQTVLSTLRKLWYVGLTTSENYTYFRGKGSEAYVSQSRGQHQVASSRSWT